MKLCHTAALTLVGWYLMAPALNQSGQVDLSANVSSWVEWSSYDTAFQCEVAKVEQENRLFAHLHESKHIDLMYAITFYSVCIEADSPPFASRLLHPENHHASKVLELPQQPTIRR